jgi:DNA polymerase III delta prime subunit
MSLKNKLFWEKYRPTIFSFDKTKNVDKSKPNIPVILLPRIKKLIENSIEKEQYLNFLFYGSGGVGKSSTVNILTKDFDLLKIDCSIDRGIDIIREQVEDFCKNYSLPIAGRSNKIKAVWFEEFDKTTPLLRGALRGFIEDERYVNNVRFFITLNNLNAVNRTEEDQALISRFNRVNFDPINKDEIIFLKTQYFKYLVAICKNINLELSEDIINNIIDKKFPNLRDMVQYIQEIFIIGDYSLYDNIQENKNSDLYSFISNGKNNLKENYFLVMDNYPKEKTEDLLLLLSRPFFKFLLDEDENFILKNGKILLDLSKEYNAEYVQTKDPEIHLINYITKIKELFIS